MLIATKTNNLQQQQQRQKNSDITLIGSNVINRNNNKKQQHEVENKHMQLTTTTSTTTTTTTTTTTNKLTEIAYGRKEDALLPCDSEAKQRHEALAKKWNMKYMHYKNNNNSNNNVHKEIDKQTQQQQQQQQQQSADTNSYLNIKVSGGNVERARRGRRPNGRGVGSRGRGMFKGNINSTGKDMPPNSLYAAAMLTVAKMKAKRGGGDNNRVLRSTGTRGKARLYTQLMSSTTNSSESCETKTTNTATVAINANKK